MNATLGVIVHETIKYDYKITGFVAAITLFMIINQARTIIKYKKRIQEVLKMDELKRQTMDVLKFLEQDMVDRIKEAEKTGEGIDLMSRNARVMDQLAKLDTAFIEAKIRVLNKNKGGLFRR